MYQTDCETKNKILLSVRELAKNSPIDKITVKQISERAGITPQTFYNHFSDKYELIVYSYKERIRRMLKERVEKNLSWKELLRLFIIDYKNNARYVINASKNTHGEDSYVAKTAGFLCECMEDEFKSRKGTNELPYDIVMMIKMYIGGVINIMNMWISGQTKLSENDMVGLLDGAIPSRLRQYYSDNNK